MAARRPPRFLGVFEHLEDRTVPHAGLLDPSFGTAGVTAVANPDFFVTPGERIPGTGHASTIGVLANGDVLMGGEVFATNSFFVA